MRSVRQFGFEQFLPAAAQHPGRLSRKVRQEVNMNRHSAQAWFERYRLAVISAWPESEAKRAALSSARAALEREVAFAASRPATASS
jgi:hypothetical protein